MKTALEVFREFLSLGLTSFGGPTAHVAFFRDRFVRDRKWMTEEEFADLLALCQFLPGPASSQLGLSIGWRRAGWPGAIAAWTAFTLPSAIALTLFGIGVVKFGGELGADAGWLRGLQIAVVAVVAGAVTSMAKTLCDGRLKMLIAMAAAAVVLATGIAWMQLVVIAAGAVAGWVLFRERQTGLSVGPDPVGHRRSESGSKDEDAGKTELAPPGADAPSRSRGVKAGVVCLVLFFVLLVGLPLLVAAFPGQPLETFSAMYRSGSLVFGGGHVVLPLLSEEVVTTGWVTREQFLAGYGAAQAVPGPLFTFSAFLGSLIEGPGGPWAMAAVALAGIFLPAWLLVLGLMPFWHKVASRPTAKAALAGTNAAVVGLLAAALYDPVWTAAIGSTRDVVFLIPVAAALLVLKWPPWLVVVLAGVAGFVVL